MRCISILTPFALSLHALSTFAPAMLLTLLALISSLPLVAEPGWAGFFVVVGFDVGLAAAGLLSAGFSGFGSVDSKAVSELDSDSSVLVCTSSISASDVFSGAVVSFSGALVPHAEKLIRTSIQTSKTAKNFFAILMPPI